MEGLPLAPPLLNLHGCNPRVQATAARTRGKAVQGDISLTPHVESALVFQLLESAPLSSHWFQMSTCTPTRWVPMQSVSPMAKQNLSKLKRSPDIQSRIHSGRAGE